MLLLLAPVAGCALLVDYHMVGAWMLSLAVLLVGAVALADYLRLRRLPALRVERRVRGSLPLNVWSPLQLHVGNGGGAVCIARCADRWPQEILVEPADFPLRLQPGEQVRVSCRVRPLQRGAYELPGLDALVRSPWGLWRQSRLFPCPQAIQVLPNFRELQRFTLLAANAELNLMGIRRIDRQGAGQDFRQLREYQPGDRLRQIDWKATSRRQRLISREYQEEHDQQIVLVLDCCRRMRHMEAGLSQFDQALNSALLLAHVAARQGDSVGFLACAGQYHWYPPTKKAHAARTLLLASTRLFPQPVAMDYQQLARELSVRLKRRSLIVVLTNTRAEEHSAVTALVRQLRSRHLLLIADLLEKEVLSEIQAPIHSPAQAWRYQALLEYLRERRRFALQLRRQGCYALDLCAEDLPPALVNTYLDIKQSRKL